MLTGSRLSRTVCSRFVWTRKWHILMDLMISTFKHYSVSMVADATITPSIGGSIKRYRFVPSEIEVYRSYTLAQLFSKVIIIGRISMNNNQQRKLDFEVITTRGTIFALNQLLEPCLLVEKPETKFRVLYCKLLWRKRLVETISELLRKQIQTIWLSLHVKPACLPVQVSEMQSNSL